MTPLLNHLLGLVHRLEFALNVTTQIIDRKQVAKILYPRILLEFAKIGPRQTFFQFRNPLCRDLAIFDEAGIGQNIVRK